MNAYSQIECPLQTSRQAAIGILLMNSVLLLSLLQAALPEYLKLVLGILFTGLACYQLALHGLRCLPGSPVHLTAMIAGEDRVWVVTCRNGQQYELHPQRPVVHPWWTRIPANGLHADVHLLADNCPQEAFRRIRVLLNH